MVFLKLWREALGSSRVATGTSGNLSLLLLKLLQGNRSSSLVGASNSVFFSSCHRDLRVPIELKRGVRPHLELRHGTLLSSQIVTGVSGLISSSDGELGFF